MIDFVSEECQGRNVMIVKLVHGQFGASLIVSILSHKLDLYSPHRGRLLN
jgi:hypothetical protein